MTEEKQGLNVSVKSFLTAIVVILILMAATYGLTFLVPGGEYARIADAKMDKGLLCLGVILGIGIALVLCSGF